MYSASSDARESWDQGTLIYAEYYHLQHFFFFLDNLVGKNTPRFHLICVSLITARVSMFYRMC